MRSVSVGEWDQYTKYLNPHNEIKFALIPLFLHEGGVHIDINCYELEKHKSIHTFIQSVLLA